MVCVTSEWLGWSASLRRDLRKRVRVSQPLAAFAGIWRWCGVIRSATGGQMSFQAQARRAGQTRRHSLEQPFANSAGMKGKTGRVVHPFGMCTEVGLPLRLPLSLMFRQRS